MMLTVILIALGMMWLTVTTHALGAVFWLKTLGKFLEHQFNAQNPVHLFRVIMLTSMVLLLLHVFQVILWALNQKIKTKPRSTFH